MDDALLKITNLLTSLLETNCPVLSGNTKAHLEVLEAQPNEVVICISAPFYDLREWKRTKSIIYTGLNANGITDYASLVNRFGAFYRGNEVPKEITDTYWVFQSSTKSQYWANKNCVVAVSQIAKEIGAKVNNELPV